MVCFRDKSFCKKSDCVHAEDCPHYFSEKLKKSSEKVNLPVSFMHEPECYRPNHVKSN
jgi:hypothetical protein